MIPEKLELATRERLKELLASQVHENLTIEYKRDLPGTSDVDKREFLADVSSFANASGGYLFYGIEEKDGIPNEILGLSCNVDLEIARLQELLRSSINPRIPNIHIFPVSGFRKGPVIVIEIAKSWIAPHMITYKNLSRFYARYSIGKSQMDTIELRTAFLLSDSLPEKVRAFRNERISVIISGETPLPLQGGAKLVLHVIPVVAFSGQCSLPLTDLRNYHELQPIGATGWNYRFNIDGFCTYSGDNLESRSYCQVFRSGQIESVWVIPRTQANSHISIPCTHYESTIIRAVSSLGSLLCKLETPTPLVILTSWINAKGATLGVDFSIYDNEAFPIDRELLTFPDVMVSEYSELSSIDETAKLLRPIFDATWNACGYQQSLNYDKNGNWTKIGKTDITSE